MQGLFKFKNNIFSTNSISEYAKECKEIQNLKNTYKLEKETYALNINLKA